MLSKKILCFLLIFIFFKVLTSVSIIRNKGILPLHRNSVGIQFFIDVENENRIETCRIYTAVKNCCLTDLDKEDCDTVTIQGGHIDIIKPRDRKTLIYPMLSVCQHDLVGYCDLVLNIRCSKKLDRLDVKIPFDTRIINRNYFHPLLVSYLGSVSSAVCETLDEDSLDNCLPINCDAKYGGSRPFYDNHVHKCITAPICIGDVNKELPSVVYAPDINICKDLENPLTIEDIYAITSGLSIVTQEIQKEDEIGIVLKSNCSTISQNLFLLKDLIFGKLCPCAKQITVDFRDACKSAVLTIFLCIISICAVLFSFVFCVNATVWVHRQWSKGNITAFVVKVKSKFNKGENIQQMSYIHSDVRNSLLREVITKDIPLELRDSVISICDRMERKVKTKKRYRSKDIGSQISLQKETIAKSSSDSTNSSGSEKEPFLKKQ